VSWKFSFNNIRVGQKNFHYSFGETFHVSFPNVWIWTF
jgi:hypothetical protein